MPYMSYIQETQEMAKSTGKACVAVDVDGAVVLMTYADFVVSKIMARHVVYFYSVKQGLLPLRPRDLQ